MLQYENNVVIIADLYPQIGITIKLEMILITAGTHINQSNILVFFKINADNETKEYNGNIAYANIV